MKTAKAIATAGLVALAAMSGCADPVNQPGQVENFREVRGGYASYGSQCPFGFYRDPKAAELVGSCDIDLDAITLTKPLAPLIVQADCTNKVIIVRNSDRTLDTTWEVMPDGYFDFTIDGGDAILATDGAGHDACVTPLAANVWGTLKCKNRDVVDIDIHTNWTMGVLVDTQPIPVSTPTLTPTPQPTSTPAPNPIPPGGPEPIPQPTMPFPFPPPSPGSGVGGRRPISSALVAPTATASRRPPREVKGTRCQLPANCQMFSAATVNQCQ